MFVKNSLELIKSSESVIERILNSKKSNENANSLPKDGESESEGDFSSDDGIDSSIKTNPNSKSTFKKSKKLKTKLGRTIKNVTFLFLLTHDLLN